jgi:DNA-binding Xre family transcriptional regulator
MARFRLKEVAKPERWNISLLAQESGVSRSTVSKIWNNKSDYVHLEVLETLARTLGVRVSELIDDNEEQPKGNSQPAHAAA